MGRQGLLGKAYEMESMMPWQWVIKIGTMNHNEDFFASGWAGHNVQGGVQGKNNPDAVSVHGIGPLPPGKYTIGAPYDSPHTGPFTLPLTPDSSNEMFGRNDFRIHGFQVGTDPGDPYNPSSDGCIILGRVWRNAIASSPDKELEVITGV